MTDLSSATIALIVFIGGVVATPVTTLIRRERWPAPVSQLVCMAVSAVVSIVAVAIDQSSLLNVRNVTSLAGLVFAWVTIAYPLIFQTTPVGRNLHAKLLGFPSKGAHAAGQVAQAA